MHVHLNQSQDLLYPQWEDKEVESSGKSPIHRQGGFLLRGEQDNRKKPKIVPTEMKLEIDSFSNIKIYYTEEDFGGSEKTRYGIVIYDAV